MPALRNQRHEKFVLALFEGKSATEAYQQAGFRPCRQNASRLMAKDDIQRRLAELQTETAATAKVTLETILADLVDAAAVAKSKGQGQALVSAAMAKAKLLGLDIQRVEIGGPGDVDDLNSTAEIVDEMLSRMIEGFYPIDAKDRQHLIELHERLLKEVGEYIAGIRARPIIGTRVNPRDLSHSWQSHEPFTPKSPTRIGYRANGSKPT